MQRVTGHLRALLGACALILTMLGAGAGLTACGDDPTTLGLRCGDNFCFGDETAETCPRDCSYACLPRASRCEGNVVATCDEDGLHETLAACEEGEVCREGACETSGSGTGSGSGAGSESE
jgi:hypothetical protein